MKMLQILEHIDSKLDASNQNNRNRARRIMDHYCWAHGAGNHKGSNCHNKKEGHKDNATFHYRMGGSNAYCKLAKKSG